MNNEYGAGIGGGFQGFVKGWSDAEDSNERRADKKQKRLEVEAKARADQEAKDRQKSQDEVSKKQKETDDRRQLFLAGYDMPQLGEGQSIADVDLNSLKMNPARMQAKADADPTARAIKQMQLDRERDAAEQRRKGEKLPPDKVLSVQQGTQIPKLLADVNDALLASKDIRGPVSGRTSGLNPWSDSATKSKTVDAQLRAASQSVGRYLEGGVLRKEDEDKYAKMMPLLTDTDEVAKNKLAIIEKMMVDKQNGDIAALSKQGYDTSAFNPLETKEGLFAGGLLKQQGPGLVQAGPGVAQSVGAVAGTNPKSNKIKVSNGKETLMIDPKDLKDAQKDGFKQAK